MAEARERCQALQRKLAVNRETIESTEEELARLAEATTKAQERLNATKEESEAVLGDFHRCIVTLPMGRLHELIDVAHQWRCDLSDVGFEVNTDDGNKCLVTNMTVYTQTRMIASVDYNRALDQYFASTEGPGAPRRRMSFEDAKNYIVASMVAEVYRIQGMHAWKHDVTT